MARKRGLGKNLATLFRRSLVTKKRILAALALLFAMILGIFIGRRVDAPLTSAPVAGSTAASAAEQRKPIGRAVLPTAHAKVALAPARNAKSAPLPPAGTPLKQTLAELQARAETGDAEAASRLYRDLQRCAIVRNINRRMPNAAAYYLNMKVDKMSADEARNAGVMLDMMDADLRYARDNAASCVDLDDGDMNNLVPSSLQAALLGDDKAASCYLGSDLLRQPGLLDHPEWLAAFKDNALPLATMAVSSGNWTVVKQLAFAYKGAFSGALLTQVTGVDPVQAYRYLKLWRLGADSGEDTEYLDSQLGEVAKQLPVQAASDADVWAQDAYQRYFMNAPHTDPRGSINICQRDEL